MNSVEPTDPTTPLPPELDTGLRYKTSKRTVTLFVLLVVLGVLGFTETRGYFERQGLHGDIRHTALVACQGTNENRQALRAVIKSAFKIPAGSKIPSDQLDRIKAKRDELLDLVAKDLDC